MDLPTEPRTRRSRIILVQQSSSLSARQYFIVLRRYLCSVSVLITFTALFCLFRSEHVILWFRFYSSSAQWHQVADWQKQLFRMVFTLLPLHGLLTLLFVFSVMAWPTLFMALGQSACIGGIAWLQLNHYPYLRISLTAYLIVITVNMLYYLYSFMIIRHNYTKQNIFEHRKRE